MYKNLIEKPLSFSFCSFSLPAIDKVGKNRQPLWRYGCTYAAFWHERCPRFTQIIYNLGKANFVAKADIVNFHHIVMLLSQ